ncbi:hypothetical protein Taro_043698 [Colocasia esculenta]|uniref:Urease accessory protein D n=1 Tax=Colocasia esculenta TaxID=4460 RepID=A0A843WK25_COLES|nr:hypothetical protein [Colocasia esculenta]
MSGIMETAADETGYLAVEMVRGRSTVTRCFAKYPLKFIVPTKAGSSRTDAVWIYALTYGGGIVSVRLPGDCVRCGMSVGDGCTAVFTTQASTKVYKSIDSKYSGQMLEVLLEQGDTSSIAQRMQDYQVIAMIILIGLKDSWSYFFLPDVSATPSPCFLSIKNFGQKMGKDSNALVCQSRPKLKDVQDKVQDNVKKMMSGSFHIPNPARGSYSRRQPELTPAKPALIASCSAFGPKAKGIVVRVAALTTESVYEFLRQQLAGMEALVGAPLYC